MSWNELEELAPEVAELDIPALDDVCASAGQAAASVNASDTQELNIRIVGHIAYPPNRAQIDCTMRAA
jgi:hypothetical protein